MALPAGYNPSRYQGELEVIRLYNKAMYGKKHMRKWARMTGRELEQRDVLVFQGRMRSGKYVNSSPVLRVDPASDDSGHKLVLVENGKWYRAIVVLDGSQAARYTLAGEWLEN